jgi:beta-glucosidase-like glycosyl hydrolase
MFLIVLLTSLFESGEGEPWLKPIDEAKSNCPGYYRTIRKPMDLETITRKLSDKKYKDIQTVLADVKRIVLNCRTYFGQSNVHTAMAEEMEAAFYHHLKNLPIAGPMLPAKPKMAEPGIQVRNLSAVATPGPVPAPGPFPFAAPAALFASEAFTDTV